MEPQQQEQLMPLPLILQCDSFKMCQFFFNGEITRMASLQSMLGQISHSGNRRHFPSQHFGLKLELHILTVEVKGKAIYMLIKVLVSN